LTFRDSIIQATAGSINEIEELQAATVTSTKNRVPKKRPPGILPKITGSVWNIRLGPALGSIPAVAKTIGKITIPAVNATRVSKMAMVTTVLPMGALSGI